MAKKRPPQKSTKPAGQPPPDAELDILSCLWQRGEATARQVREALDNHRPMTQGAAVTLLKRLQAKGLVARRKGPVGKAFIYRPTRSARPIHKRLVRNMSERIFGGNGVKMVATLFDAKPPTTEEMDRLQQLLKELRLKASKRKKSS